MNPVTGPVFIDGAEPGDAIKVTILALGPSGWGWTANIPGFGLLADQFPEPALHVWRYEQNPLSAAAYGPGGRVPLKPFCGTIGLAPAEAGTHSVVPPRRVGGNMDIRDLGAGTELWLAGRGRGRPALGRRHPCRPGRWRSVRYRDRKPDVGGAENSSWRRGAAPKLSAASARPDR